MASRIARRSAAPASACGKSEAFMTGTLRPDRLEARRNALVPRRADPRIAIFARRELVRTDTDANALRSLQMIEAETIRQREVPGRHRLIDGDGDDCARSLRRQSHPPSIDDAD